MVRTGPAKDSPPSHCRYCSPTPAGQTGQGPDAAGQTVQ